ncbi:MAG: glycosyl transferase [Candidatus Improbicoccus pseudotrichonymphae]|uniref:Glycosyl transferase n=1 Tax=Candidatus Improbicoccus pseudotrichonymphae TaxID=3033792 RepID=A0AA48HXU5_9FIRM|nr:MAG: glycosyl transferase [Candidatus Improbicoccus pseudotrichonymphae]
MTTFKRCGIIMNSMIEVTVSVIVPVYNEEHYIVDFLDSMVKQDFIKKEDKYNFEAIFINNCSDDKTKDILNSYKKKFEFIRVVNNSKNSIPMALNLGIKSAKGKYIIRMDAHSIYNFDYISKCIHFLELTKSQNVGGPMIAEGKTRIQKIIASAYFSKFALGGGKNHDEKFEGYTDTVFLGCFEKEYLIKIGMYDENLEGSEDDELNFRINNNFGKIYITPKIKSIYYPRKTLTKLFKQYFNYGFHKVKLIRKYKKIIRISHLIPAFFVMFIFLSVVLCFSKMFLLLSGTVFAIYLALNLYFSLSNKKLNKISDKIFLLLVHFVMHFSYGIGFLLSCIKKNKKEINNLLLGKEDLRNLQMKNLEMFNYFKNFCEKNNLIFFVCGGCCIGTIRHEGFIPWDDDMDVFMLRNDYEKFKSLWKNNEKYYINSEFYSFTKFIDKNTTLINKEDILRKNIIGVSLDIFPLDGCPKSKLKRCMQIFCALMYCLYSSNMIPQKHGLIIKFLCTVLLRLPSVKIKIKLSSFFEKKMSKYPIDDCEKITELCAGPRYIFNEYPKEIFGSCVFKKFEGQSVPIPIGYDEYLKTAFGDYMKIPPKSKQKTDHEIVFMDLKKFSAINDFWLTK